jgi:hypothetical protein
MNPSLLLKRWTERLKNIRLYKTKFLSSGSIMMTETGWRISTRIAPESFRTICPGGVLTEDAIYDLLTDQARLREEFTELSKE